MASVVRLFGAIAFLFVVTTSANATCPTFHTLTNGTTADANQVMDNYNYILNCPGFTASVGIGTTAPDASLSIKTTSQNAVVDIYGVLSGLDYGVVQVSSSGSLTNPAGRPLALQPNAGFVGIGNTAPDASLSVQTLGQNAVVDIYGVSSATDYGAIQVSSSGSLTNPAGRALALQPNAGKVGIGTTSPSYTLHVNGSVAGTSAYNNLSDARLKKNIVTIQDALATVEKLRGVRFDWRRPEERTAGRSLNLPVGEPQVGFVAQEVRLILPEAVTVSHDKEAIMSTEESKVVPVLVEAMKTLIASNKNQTAEIRKLQHQISELQRKVNIQTATKSNHIRAAWEQKKSNRLSGRRYQQAAFSQREDRIAHPVD